MEMLDILLYKDKLVIHLKNLEKIKHKKPHLLLKLILLFLAPYLFNQMKKFKLKINQKNFKII